MGGLLCARRRPRSHDGEEAACAEEPTLPDGEEAADSESSSEITVPVPRLERRRTSTRSYTDQRLEAEALSGTPTARQGAADELRLRGVLGW